MAQFLWRGRARRIGQSTRHVLTARLWSLFEFDVLSKRLKRLVEMDIDLKPESARLLEEALIRGEFDRGESARITGKPSARRGAS